MREMLLIVHTGPRVGTSDSFPGCSGSWCAGWCVVFRVGESARGLRGHGDGKTQVQINCIQKFEGPTQHQSSYSALTTSSVSHPKISQSQLHDDGRQTHT
ncbi:hypothetical protein CC80DRAFT_281823 [Byssothecium circinans]|uniref:Uncharacterized protein n=1 Tax=Byssothecium circinans TaxID=147558 RepID=A0A6A5T9W3_9PLEO|nr:hypothetical protein CC80DRAFT_281823 [Byssothecium circinans]